MRKIHSKLNVFENCREEGIRTLDTLLAYTHFPGVRLRPLGHLSIFFLLKRTPRQMGCQITKKK